VEEFTVRPAPPAGSGLQQVRVVSPFVCALLLCLVLLYVAGYVRAYKQCKGSAACSDQREVMGLTLSPRCFLHYRGRSQKLMFVAENYNI